MSWVTFNMEKDRLLALLNQALEKHRDLFTEKQLENWAKMIQLDDPDLVFDAVEHVMEWEDLMEIPQGEAYYDWAQDVVWATLDYLDLLAWTGVS
jgi:hypothetical protein